MSQDRREVAEQFISDLLHGGEINWSHVSGGSLNLGEATNLVRDTLDLTLAVRGSDGLSGSADSNLRHWLLTRNVQVGGQTQTLSFAEFEDLLDEHAVHLLGYLGADYSDQAIAAIQSNEGSVSSIEVTLSHIGSVFQQLADNGQEERAILWSQLARLVTVDSIEASDTAWKIAARHNELADASQAREFLSAFAARLIQYLKSADDIELEWSERGSQFNDLLTRWNNYLDDTTAFAIEPLISGWALSQECTEFALRALNLVLKQSKPAWDKSVSALLETEMLKMPPRICAYVGQHASSLTDDHVSGLVGQMDAIIDQSQLEHDASANYHQYVRSVPIGTWSAPTWREHLERLFSRTSDMHADPNFITLLFPSVIHLFAAAPDGRTAMLIEPLFSNTAGSPDAYVALHKSIVGHWPKTDDHVGDYHPDSVVETACQFIEKHPDRGEIGDIFGSLIDLSDRSGASDVSYERIASVTPIVWRVAHRQLIAKLDHVSNALEPSQTAAILIGDQPADLHRDELVALLKPIVDASDSDAHYDVLRAILEQQPTTLFNTPDGTLGEWFTATGDMSDAIARRALGDEALNDEQCRRVAAKLTDAFWVEGDMQSVETVLKLADAPSARASLVERLQDISNQSLPDERKTVLSSRLIASLPSLSGEELVTVGRVILKLGGRGALEKSAAVLEQLDGDQRHALRTIYPDSKFLADFSTS